MLGSAKRERVDLDYAGLYWLAPVTMGYLKFPLDNGEVVFLESEEIAGARPVSVLGDRAEQAAALLESSLDSIRSVASRVIEHLQQGMPARPQEIELTFGIKASAELNTLVVAKAGGEANFTVKLKWVQS